MINNSIQVSRKEISHQGESLEQQANLSLQKNEWTSQITHQKQSGQSSMTFFEKEVKKTSIFQIFAAFLLIALTIGYVIGVLFSYYSLKESDEYINLYSQQKIKEIYNSDYYKKTIFNEINSFKQFGREESFYINLTSIIFNKKNIWESIHPTNKKQYNNQIYILPPREFNALIAEIDFEKLRKQLQDYFAFELLQFESKPVSQLSKLKYQHFKSNEQIEKYFFKLRSDSSQQVEQPGQRQLDLAIHIVKNSKDKKVIQAEYYLIDKKYNISSTQRQISICIYSGGRNLYQRDQYKQLLDSIQLLNYTNYHVVYVDDNSEDKYAYKIYNYIKSKDMSLKNRIKIIRNLQEIGNLGSTYFYTQKFCKNDQIIILVDADDAFVGRQSLKVLNKLYQNQNIWAIQSKYIIFNEKQNQFLTDNISLLTHHSFDRRSENMSKPTLISFRSKLIQKIPLYQLIQYHYDGKTGIGWPSFPLFASKTYLLTSIFELAGKQRIKELDDYFYRYYGPSLFTRPCYLLNQILDSSKSSLKVPLQKLNSILQSPRQINFNYYKYPQEKFNLVTQLLKKGKSYKCFN